MNLWARRDNLNSREAARDKVSLHKTLEGLTEGEDSLSPVEAASQRDIELLFIYTGPQSQIQRLRTSWELILNLVLLQLVLQLPEQLG